MQVLGGLSFLADLLLLLAASIDIILAVRFFIVSEVF